MSDHHRARRDKLRDDSREDFSQPPEICEVPSFVSSDASQSTHPLMRSRQMSDGRASRSNLSNTGYQPSPQSGPGGLETLVSAFAPPSPCDDDGPWWAMDGHYMCISVREARGLTVVDEVSKSISSFVKVAVGGDTEGSKAQEASTRTCHRNRNPFYAQTFFFPLEGLDFNTRLCVDVHGSTTDQMSVLDRFCGQVLTTLGHLLDPVGDVMEPFSRYYRLTRRRPSDRVSGDILLIVGVVPKYVYDAMHWSEDPSTLLDPSIQKQLLSSYSLSAYLHDIKQLKLAPGQDVGELLSALTIRIRLGKTMVTQKLQPTEVVISNEGASRVVSFRIDQKVSLPLEKSFEVSRKKLNKKERDEVGEIKVYLQEGQETVAKTQMPVWDIPVVDDGDEDEEKAGEDPAIDHTEGDEESGDKPALTRIVTSTSEKGKQAVGTYLDLMASASRRKPLAGVNPAAAQLGPERMGLSASPTSAGGSAATQQPAPESTGLQTTADDDVLESPFVSASLIRVSMTASGMKSDLDSRFGQSRASSAQVTPARRDSRASSITSMMRAGTPQQDDADPDGGAQLRKLTGLALARNLMRDHSGRVQYKRAMESYAPSISSGPLLNVSFCLETTTADSVGGAPAAEAACETAVNEKGDSDEEDDGGVPQAISLPPLLPVIVGEVRVAGRPVAVLDTLFQSESPFRTKMIAKEALLKFVCGPWVPDPANKGAKMRTTSYIRPLMIPIPMAPKQANVQEEEHMLVREAGGFVFEKKVTTDAPKGDTFFILIRITGLPEGPNGTLLQSSFKVEWVKSPGFLKGAIEGGAISNTKKLLLDQSAELLKALGPPSAVARVKVAKGQGAASPAAAPPVYVPLLEGTRPTDSANGFGSKGLLTVTCLLAVIVGLLVLLLAVSLAQLSALRGMQQSAGGQHCSPS